MRPDRRTLLKGLSLLPLAGMAAAHAPRGEAGTGAVRFIADARMPGSRALALAARRRGHEVADPRGEIVAHVLAQGPDWLRSSGPIIGLTSYTDMMLMRDLARGAGRPMRYAARWGAMGKPPVDRLKGAEASFVAALAGAPVRAGQPAAFLWLV